MDSPLILVNENDEELGTCEKLLAHQQGLLHRAFSVFVFNSRGELLLHRRAAGKYHSAGLWTNTCCSHPLPGEDILDAAQRRLRFEMGFECRLEKAFSFLYRAELNNGLIEHELDHVFVGQSNALPNPNPQEADQWHYITVAALDKALHKTPQLYTSWLQVAWPLVKDFISTWKQGQD